MLQAIAEQSRSEQSGAADTSRRQDRCPEPHGRKRMQSERASRQGSRFSVSCRSCGPALLRNPDLSRRLAGREGGEGGQPLAPSRDWNYLY